MRSSSLGRTIALLLLSPIVAQAQRRQSSFHIEEATIADVHAALKAGTVTCHSLVQRYLDRIDAYDKKGPALNAIVLINPTALADADELDRRFTQSGLVGPLHCIPTIVKDNYQTAGLQTTGGSLSLKGWLPANDATVVKRMRDAGAIVLAKSNMAEFAFSPLETVSSILPGYTRNAYALDRVTAGSSGGTADAVAASFGTVGLGTDTGNSIRGPSSFLALIGIRPTMGLTSRAGVVPLFLNADVTGPMTRTVADAAAVLQVIAGPDAADSATARAEGKVPASYASSLVRDALKGARIGVLHQAYERPSADSEVIAVFKKSLDEMRSAGAVIVDPVAIDSLDALFRIQSGACSPFKTDLNRFLAGAGDKIPMHSLDEVIKSRQFHPSIEKRLLDPQAVADAPEQSPGCKSREEFRARLRTAVLALMDKSSLDALVYPTWSNAQRLIGDLNTPGGDNNQLFSPSTGFPAITVPMGWLRGGVLPAGVQFFGRPWSEAKLIGLAYSYEQATHHRHAPPNTPALVAKRK
ncbi:MAG: amidase family protein [Gemmatimonadota bacterium]|nr:amidase family protein [Gemmatimonadota bacterium]